MALISTPMFVFIFFLGWRDLTSFSYLEDYKSHCCSFFTVISLITNLLIQIFRTLVVKHEVCEYASILVQLVCN